MDRENYNQPDALQSVWLSFCPHLIALIFDSLLDVLDAMPIVVAMFSLNVFHPGYLIGRDQSTDDEVAHDSPRSSDSKIIS